MKVAISSGSFGGPIGTGELTQLEWLERSASALGADGIVFAGAHFPRSDPEYVAQLRKVAVDLGLVPLAIDEPRLLSPGFADDERRAAFALAAGLGAHFVLTELPPPGDVPPAAFVAAVGAAKAAAGAAKAANVTLLVAPAAGTLGPDVPALQHFRKDVDSAWLRYALPAGADRSTWGARDRVLLVTVDPADDLEALAEIDEAARPWLLLTGEVTADRVAALRRAGARKMLAATGIL